MSKGIYCYTDLNDGSIVYIGKDSNINRNQRHTDHLNPAMYNHQPFNRVIQNNPERYVYEVLCETEHYSDIYLNCLEKGLIKTYDPKFNFTIGGEGTKGLKHSLESRKRRSEWMKGNNHALGYKHSIQHNKKISESKKGVPQPKETTLNMIKTKNTSGIYRVSKQTNSRYKQGFRWIYQYFDENGKLRVITSVDLDKLESKVKSKGLDWINVEELVL